MKALHRLPLLPTAIVGSYPQPGWLIDRKGLKSRLPPRVRAQVVANRFRQLAVAQNAATLMAISDQELAGIDIAGDGEMRRESSANQLANALDGIDIDNPGSALDRTGSPNPVPRVTGPIRRLSPIAVDDARFLRERTKATIKITIPGPFTLTQQAQNDYYKSDEALAMDYAEVVNAEMRDLFAAEVDIVQLD